MTPLEDAKGLRPAVALVTALCLAALLQIPWLDQLECWLLLSGGLSVALAVIGGALVRGRTPEIAAPAAGFLSAFGVAAAVLAALLCADLVLYLPPMEPDCACEPQPTVFSQCLLLCSFLALPFALLVSVGAAVLAVIHRPHWTSWTALVGCSLTATGICATVLGL